MAEVIKKVKGFVNRNGDKFELEPGEHTHTCSEISDFNQQVESIISEFIENDSSEDVPLNIEERLSALESGKSNKNHTHDEISDSEGNQEGHVYIDNQTQGDPIIEFYLKEGSNQKIAQLSLDNIDNLNKALNGQYLTEHQDLSGKADKVSSPVNGHFVGLDSNGNITDSGYSSSSFIAASRGVTDTITGASQTQLVTAGGVYTAIQNALTGSSSVFVTSLPIPSSTYLNVERLYIGTTSTYEFGQTYKCVSESTYSLALNINFGNMNLTAEQYTAFKAWLESDYNVDTSEFPAYGTIKWYSEKGDTGGTLIEGVLFYTKNEENLSASQFVSSIGSASSNTYGLSEDNNSLILPYGGDFSSATTYKWSPKYTLKSDLS